VLDDRPDELLSPAELELRYRSGLFSPVLGMTLLAALVIVAFFYVVAAVGAVVGGVIILYLTKLFGRRDITYAETYPAAFAGFSVYLGVSMVMTLLFGEAQRPPPGASVSDIVSTIAAMQTVPVLSCALMVMRQLGTPYAGILGFLRAVVAAALSLVISLVVCAVVFIQAGEGVARIAAIRMNPNDVADALTYIALPLALLSAIGGLFTAALLRAPAKREPKAASFARLYATGALALLAYALSIVLVEAAGGTIDPLFAWLYNEWVPWRPGMVPREPLPPLNWLLLSAAVAQLAAIAGAAAVLIYRMPSAFAGTRWINAYVIALISVAVVFTPLIAIAVYGMGGMVI